MPALQPRLLRLAAAITAGTAVLAAGQAQATTCTYASISANTCAAFSLGALTFSNFTRAPGSGDDADIFSVSLLPNYDYLIANSFFQADSAYLTGNGSIGFTVTTNTPGYNILSVSGNSDTSNGGLPKFTFTNTLSGIASPIVSQGTPFGPIDFDPNTTTSNVQVAWTQGFATNVGISTSLRLRTNPPEPPTVPAPLPLLGVGGAFGFSRHLRRRLKQAGWRRS
jgi:hypothetical protein